MAWNYRKRVKIAPGVHLNFSKNGVSTSIGPKGSSITFGKNGKYLNTSIPGTGLYNRQKIGGGKKSSPSMQTTNENNNNGCVFVLILMFILSIAALQVNNTLMYIVIGIMGLILGTCAIYLSKDSNESRSDVNENGVESTDDTSEDVNEQEATEPVFAKDSCTNKKQPFLGVYDPLFEDAATLLIKKGNASTSFLQRALSIGYNRAGLIMDQLESVGVVGPANSSSPRELLVHNEDDWLIMKSRLLVEMAERMKNGEQLSTKEPSLHHITKEQFEFIKKESDSLCSFVRNVVKKKNVRAKLDEMLQIENSDGIPMEVSMKINLAVITDVYRCYKGLGHDFFTDDDDENIGIYLFVGKYISPKTEMYYHSLSEFKPRLKESMVNMLETSEQLNNNAKILPNEFFLQKALGECDRELQTQYMSLLYRFASAVAKADGRVNETETKWLADIMKSKELNVGNGSNVRTTSEQDNTSIESPYEKLNDLIGLDTVKEEITKLANFIKIQQVRQAKGLKSPEISYHCVFTGNPGTGKTTVARIMASIYRELGILKKGHLVETDRSGLVAEYVGQTAVKTNKIIDSALDGVLFIDEAYSLVQGAKEDFGQEAISTLLKRMEDDRNRLVVILAGYSSEMKGFIDSNPGLQSRFNRYIHFSDYDANDLEKIFLLNAQKNQYLLSEDASEKLKDVMIDAIAHKDVNFGNARFVRNLFEKSIQNQAMRLAPLSNITEEDLSKIKAEDIPNN